MHQAGPATLGYRQFLCLPCSGAQNLIANSGFDSIELCTTSALIHNTPNGIYKIAPPWSKLSNLTFNTPDILNRCSTTPEFWVPANKGGSYQEPLSGDGYAGLWTSIKSTPLREYLITKLLKELKKGRQYYVSLYVSPLSYSKSSNTTVRYTDAFGIVFSADTISANQGLRLITPESVGNPKGRFIKDTIGWTKISGCYKAKGGEKYATIGNFRPDAEVMIDIDNPQLPTEDAYHYVDNVSVLDFNPLPDTTVQMCIGETQKLNAAFPMATAYRWNTGATDSVITVSKSGVYSVQVTIDNCIFTDTVDVLVLPETQKQLQVLGADTTFCEGKPTELSAAGIYGQYAWSTGAKTPSIVISKANNYAVTVTNRCGEYADDVSIMFKKCDCRVFVPTAFSPNGDGVNDALEVYFGCSFDYKVKRFQIYNRWGDLVFTAENTNTIKWNGQMNNQKPNSDAYVWFLEYEYEENGETKKVVESGNFTIIY